MVRVNQACGTARLVIPGRLSIVDALLLVNACLAAQSGQLPAGPGMSVESKARCWGRCTDPLRHRAASPNSLQAGGTARRARAAPAFGGKTTVADLRC